MLEVYDKSLKRLAFLQNAHEIKRGSVFEGVGSLSFKIPKDDPKIKHCEYMNFVRYAMKVNGQAKYTDYYRIAEMPGDVDNGKTPEVEFYCEHGIITLIDKLMFGSCTVGGMGYYTSQVINYILAKQEAVYWQLGECDFARQFEYSWSQENLLAALFSVPNLFAADYMFTYDMSTFPWTVNLKRFDATVQPKYYIRKRLNQLLVKKMGDAKQIVTRIFPLGYGEGVNQLTIADVNNGVPYLQAPQAIIDKYGIVERPFIDRRFTVAESLKERAQVLLDGYMVPYEEYEVEASELFTSNNMVDPMPNAGDIVSVPSSGIKTYITEVDTLLDEPGNMMITIANKPRDISGTIASQADRQRIEQVYAQGATNIFSYSFRDNADVDKPLRESFFIPAESVKINLVMLKFELRNFRAYETGAASGGAMSSTSEAGGSSYSTSDWGGSSYSTSEAGGGSFKSTGTDSEKSRTSGSSSKSTSDSDGSYSDSNNTAGATATSGYFTQTGTTESHTHGVPNHKHAMVVSIPSHSHGMSHTHSFTIPAHDHTVSFDPHTHTFVIPNHTHGFSIPGHTHGFEIEDHTHDIVYGIYEGGRADSVSLKVDGTIVPIAPDTGEVDIAPYLSVDSSGKVQRGAYHDIEITPNKLTGIIGSITIQLFIQSQGGGDY